MDLTSKLSLYDILTQLISGFLILALFIPIPESTLKCICMEDGIETYHWIFLIIFSYLIGIIYHRLLEWFRRYKIGKLFLLSLPICLLIGGFQGVLKCSECRFCIIMILIVLGVIIFLIKFGWFQTIFERNNDKAITKAYNKIYSTNRKDYEKVTKEYYDTYYSIMDKPAYGTISILETQEAFLRNITWIVVAYHLCYYYSWKENTLFECIFIVDPPSILSSNCLILCVSLFLFLFLILFARYHTQMKVYKAVWDAGKYLKNSKP